jgi:hypothetical protein
MLNLFKRNNSNKKDILIEIINTIIPKEHTFEIEHFKKVVETPEKVINLQNTGSFYGLRSKSDENFDLFVLFDVLRDGYLTKFDNRFDNEYLWGTLSALLTTYGYEKFRQELSYEIYENDSKKYTINNCNTILKNSPFVFYEIAKNDFKAVSVINKKSFSKIKELFKKLNVQVKVLN